MPHPDFIFPGEIIWFIHGTNGIRKCQVRSMPRASGWGGSPKYDRVTIRPFNHDRGEFHDRNISVMVFHLRPDPGFPIDEDPSRPVVLGAQFWAPYSNTGIRRVEIAKVGPHGVQVKNYNHHGDRWLRSRDTISRSVLR